MMKFTDRANIGQVKRTEEGYIATQARALRTGMSLLVRDGTTFTLPPVTVGANDSGGTGFRVLRVPNA